MAVDDISDVFCKHFAINNLYFEATQLFSLSFIDFAVFSNNSNLGHYLYAEMTTKATSGLSQSVKTGLFYH